MKKTNSCSRLLAWTAMLGMVLPVSAAGAEPTRDYPNQRPAIKDAALGKSGILRGSVYNAQGVPLPGVDVAVLTIDGKAVQSRTTEKGEFAVGGLKGGVYQVMAGQGSQVIRAWSEGTAPPTAQRQVLVISDPRVAVGQYEPGTFGYFLQEAKYTLSNPLVMGGIIAAAVAIPVAIHNANDDDEGTGS
jgi:hypothetical protein